MTFFLFELKKLYKNKMLFLYLIMTISVVSVIFFFNRQQLVQTKNKLIQQHTVVQNFAKSYLDNFNFIEKNGQLSEEQKNSKLSIQGILDNSNKIIESIDSKDSKSYLEHRSKEIILLQNFYKEPFNQDYFFPKDIESKENLVISNMIETKQTYEDENNSINLPNFMFLLSTNLTKFPVIIFILILMNAPYLLDYFSSNIKLMNVEINNNKNLTKPTQVYQLFQFSLMLLCSLIGTMAVIVLCKLFGGGLIANVTNSFSYPVVIGNSDELTTIKTLLINKAIIFIPFMYLLNQILYRGIIITQKPIPYVSLFVLSNIIIFELSKSLSGLQQYWNPWFILTNETNAKTTQLLYISLVLIFISYLVNYLIKKKEKEYAKV